MIASTNSGTLPKLPGRIACWLTSRKKRSTRLSQEEPVGTKCRWMRGCLANQALTLACLWVAELSTIRCRSNSGGVSRSICFRKSSHWRWVCLGAVCATHFALQVVQGGKERHGAVAVIVVGFGAQLTGAQRQARLAALQGLDLGLFIATYHQRV